VAARLDEPDDQAVMQEMGLDQTQWQAEGVSAGEPATGTTPEAGTGTGTGMGNMTPAQLVEEAGDEFQSENLDRLRTWSIVAGFGLAIISGFGGFALSGIILRPMRDITEVASEISATNLSQRINHEGPDDELKQLADTFDSMIDRIERGFEAQRRFVQDASHELRTPLAAIRTNIEVAEMASDGDYEEQRAMLETVKGQTERLTRLSEDLLLLTAPQAALPLEAVSPGDLVTMALEELAPLAHRANVTLSATGSSTCEAIASTDLLYRCVLNLVDNAVKHTGEGAAVTVGVACEGEHVSIRVKDTGPGIPQEDLAHVFERFYRVDRSRVRGRGGSGLGLAIVRELMDSMGGEVDVESSPGQGATFTLRVLHASTTNGTGPHHAGIVTP
jgi:signal transduction histidine kinase